MSAKEIDSLGWELLRKEKIGPDKFTPDAEFTLLNFKTKEMHACPLCLDHNYRYIAGTVEADCISLMREFKERQDRFEAGGDPNRD